MNIVSNQRTKACLMFWMPFLCNNNTSMGCSTTRVVATFLVVFLDLALPFLVVVVVVVVVPP